MNKSPYLIIVALTGGALCLALSGCTVLSEDHGKWTASYTTAISVEHTTADTGDTVAKTSVDTQPWVKGLLTWWTKEGNEDVKEEPTATP